MLMMKAGVFRPSKLVSLRAIKELTLDRDRERRAEGRRDDAARGAGAFRRRCSKHAPVITKTLRTLSNIRVRNVATVGGALAHADPHMDLPPVLIALGARVVVQGKSGERTIPVADLFAGYFETVLAKDELISSLIVPAQDGRRAAYLKCTTRAVHDWPALGVAVSVAADGNAIKDASIVVSAATEKPGRLAGAEKAAQGRGRRCRDSAAPARRRRRRRS